MINSRKPLLRFSGFSEPWELKKMGDIAEYKTTSLKVTDSNNKGLYTLYDANSQIGFVDEQGFDKEYISIIKDGSGVGRTRKMSINTSIVATMGAIIPIDINVEFLYNNMQLWNFESYIIGGAIPHVYFNSYKEQFIYFPSLPEQTKIGDLFNNIDSFILKQEDKYNKLLDIKKSLLNKMFPIENTFIPSIRFNDYSEEWDEKKLGDYLYDPLLVQLNVTKSEQIITLGLNLSGIRSGSTKNGIYFGATKYFVRHSGQLLYGKQNFFNGSMAIIGDQFEGKGTSGDVPSFDIKYIDKHFLYYYIARPEYYEDKERESIGTGSKRIHQSVLKEFLILNPKNIDEQYKIGQLFNKLENLANLYTSKIEKLKTIKQSLLKVMFV